MAVCVVDKLEAVQVQKRQADRRLQTQAAVQLASQHVVEVSHVVEASGVVGDGQLLNARHVARIFNGDGGVVGQDVQERHRVIVHLVGARVQNFDYALRAFASAQGQRN